MNAAPQGIIPTSSNSIYGPADQDTHMTTTTTQYNYQPVPAAPPNPADLVQIPLRFVANKKKSNIARFHTPNNTPMDFNTMAHPVKMYRAPEVSEPEPVPPPKENPYFKKKGSQYEKKPVIKDAKAIPLHIEDNEGNHSYDGVLEGGQTSNYALLVFENGVFNVIPVGDWYNFRPKRTYTTFSTEEAEIMMNKRSELAKKLAEKHGQLQAIVKTEDGAGGGGAPDKEDAEFTTNTEDDDPDRFAAFGRADSDEEKKKKQTKQKSVKKEEGGDSDNGEEPDWEGVFDDDEPDAFGGADDEPDQPPGRDREEAEGDGEDKDLTEAGKEMRNILKKQKEDDLSEAGSEFGSDEDDDDDEDEDDFNLEEKLPFINQLKFGSNSASATENKQEDSTAKEPEETRPSPQQAPETPVTGEKEKKKSPNGSKKKGRSKEKEAKEETSPKGEKPKKSRSAKKPAGGAKRGATEGEMKSPPTSTKKPKLETTPKLEAVAKPAASPAKPAAALGGPAVTEEEVRRVLSQGKRLRTLDLVGHFKAALVDAKQKQKFTELTRRLCSIVEEGGVKYLMLK